MFLSILIAASLQQPSAPYLEQHPSDDSLSTGLPELLSDLRLAGNEESVSEERVSEERMIDEEITLPDEEITLLDEEKCGLMKVMNSLMT